MSIRIFYDNINYRFYGWKKAVKLFKKVITDNNKVSGDLNFIITSDKVLREMNIKFLNHDYNTDVIAFENNYKNIINGEIYISKDTVKRNSVNYKVSLKEEMLRVMIHGVLHMVGFNDKKEKEKMVMRREEDRWLREFKEEKNGIQI